MPSSTQDAPPERLEDAMHRLEEIIGQMDDEDLSIDELLQRYQQGTELLGNCRRQITDFRDKVEKITKTLEETSTGWTRSRKQTEQPARFHRQF